MSQLVRPRLILASQSPYRLQLLREAGYEVEPRPANLVEPDPLSLGDLQAGLIHIAVLKARHIAREGSAGLILAADTVGHAAGQVFGKPADRLQARAMLESISGTRHEVLTGWCLLRTRDGVTISGCETTTVHMRPWTETELQDYLDSNAWQGKCGAYGLQLPVDPFVTQLEGSPSNVIGVPLERLERVIREFPALIG